MKMPYKLPLIVRSKNGDWFVKYWYELPDCPGEYKEFRVRDGINYEHDLAKKEIEIQKLATDIANALEKEKYNPFEQSVKVKRQIIRKKMKVIAYDAASEKWTIEKGLDEFINYCKWKNLSTETVRTYRSFLSNFKEWLTETGKLKVACCEYLETDYIDFADTYYEDEDWSPRTYNNHIRFMGTLFKRLQILERKRERTLQYHIQLEDLQYKKDRAEKNRAYSGTVAEHVKEALRAPKYKKLNQYIRFLYLSCIRPKEIRLLKVENIDLKNRQIKVTNPTGKTGDRFVPISDELLGLLDELNINSLPFNYYLFGKGGEPGSSTFGRTHFCEQYAVIKKDLKLDKNLYTMYGWKHTRVIDLITAGFADEQIMQLTGHRDYQSFLAYKRDLVISNTEMKGKTIGWT
ncbi:MAG: site-specific integrase [Sphingobacteriales bacterium]|nr:MAG: site-specific integrase [Sphingobacteriales bacterium]